MGFWTFLLAAFLALPKQLAAVYLGVAENSGAPTDDNGSTYRLSVKTLSDSLILLSVLRAFHRQEPDEDDAYH